MVYIPPPQLAGPNRASYGQAYADILTTYRRSPLTSASSVVILVAPDVDALCAARMLADLFKQDDIVYRIRPVSGIIELERVRDELMSTPEVLSTFDSSFRFLSSYVIPPAAHTYPPQHGRDSGFALL